MIFSTTGNRADKRLFSLDDLFELSGISGIKLSPDGRQIVCVITKVDIEQNSTKDFITLINIADKQQELLFEGGSPCWSPDGLEIAYESEEGFLCIYTVKTRERRCSTRINYSSYFMGHLADKNFHWSPDGKYIAFLSTLPFQARDDKENEVRIINRLLYKTKGGSGRPVFTDDNLTHIWLIPVLHGKPELITSGSYNEHSVSWAADSLHIAFVSNRSDDPDNNQCHDLWTVNIATKNIVRLTDNFGTIFQPTCSPDGKWIAFLATTNKVTTNDSPSEDTHLYMLPAAGGSPICLTKALDRRVEDISWHTNSSFIYFTAGSEGKTSIYRIAIKTNTIETVVDGKFNVLEYALSIEGNDIAYICMDVNHPVEIFLFQQEQDNCIQITNQNTGLINKCFIQNANSFWFKSFDETLVQGWIMKPVYFNASEKYPLILVIHGGPHNMFGYDFEERMQLLTARGYAVLFINPRGSSGYGQSFSNGNLLNWGGGDYKDLMAGLDYIIDENKWIDKDRLGVTGQSYGGYMTNWMITQTNRFKAAVVDGGISNLISFSGTSLYHSLIESEFNGNAFDNFPLLWQWSPLRNVKNVITPTLFVHGELDNEVPVSQAEEMYVALKKLNVETTLVQYIGEGHGWRPDLKPKNKYDLFHRMINWFDRYLNGDQIP